MRRLMHIAVTGLLAATVLAGCAKLKNIRSESAFRQNAEEQNFGHVITASKLVSGVIVQVTYLGGAFYHLEVNNTLPHVINLVWDESVYVDTKGESVRLLHIARKNDLARDPPAQQPTPPIAPASRYQADFIGESWLDAARRGVTPQPKDNLKKARLYLTFNIRGKRTEWQGEIAFAPSPRPECEQKLASCSPAILTLPQP